MASRRRKTKAIRIRKEVKIEVRRLRDQGQKINRHDIKFMRLDRK